MPLSLVASTFLYVRKVARGYYENLLCGSNLATIPLSNTEGFIAVLAVNLKR